MTPLQELPLPEWPTPLASGEVSLQFAGLVPGDASAGLVPYYHFRILHSDGTDVGHINFRVGDTDHVRLYAGHIGFQIHESSRGHAYAEAACRALGPYIRSVHPEVVITCDPENHASRRTIERLGARFLEELAVPPTDVAYRGGARRKRRYLWKP